jgi:membrane protein
LERAGKLARACFWIIRETFDAFIRDDCAERAAGLAFYTLFSLAPLLVIVLKLTALVIDPEAVGQYVEQQAGTLIGEAGAEQVQTILEVQALNAPGSVVASIVSAGAVILGAMTVLVQLQRALNHVWRVQPAPGLNLGPFILKRAISLAMMVIIAFLLVVSLLASALLGAASGWLASWLPPSLGSPATAAIDVIASFFVFGAMFSCVFKFLPDVSLTWRQVSVGGLVTSALFVVGKSLIGRYLGSSAIASFYGAAGSLAVVLVWVYYNAILVLFGAELTRAYATWLGERVRPQPYAVPEANGATPAMPPAAKG